MNIRSTYFAYNNYIMFIRAHIKTGTPHKSSTHYGANESKLLIQLSNVAAKFCWYLSPIVSKLYIDTR